MAPQGDAKSMTLRIDENLAERVRAIAEVEETTVSDVIRSALAGDVVPGWRGLAGPRWCEPSM